MFFFEKDIFFQCVDSNGELVAGNDILKSL